MKILVRFFSLVCLLTLLAACSGTVTQAPTLEPKAPVVTPTLTIEAAAKERNSDYQDLPFDTFLEITYRDLKLRFPEDYVQLSLDAIYEIDPLELNDFSLEYQQETREMFTVVLDALLTYDVVTLSPEQQLSFDLYQYWLEDALAGDDFRLHTYIESGFDSTSASAATEFYFSDILVLENLEDAQDYLARLDKVDEKLNQIRDGLEERRAAGVVPPQILFQRLLARVGQTAASPPNHTVFYTSLESKLNKLDKIDLAQKEALLSQAEAMIASDILPAYQDYLGFLRELSSEAPQLIGVSQFPKGDAYYQYLLNSYTTTDLTVEEIHQIGFSELVRIHGEMRLLFNELGYPASDPLENLYARVAEECGSVVGAGAKTAYEAIIDDAEQHLDAAFARIPGQEVIVVADPFGGFYVPGAIDGSRPGAFYASTTNAVSRYTMPTLTYHETVPGHHLQIALAQELDLPTFRRVESSTAYVEGWALYAERLAKELGWYQNDICGDLGRLQYEAFRAARLVVDTGIHAMSWDFDRAVDFFVENTGFSIGFSQSQIYRYIAYPGQSTAYMIGLLKILELRELCQAQMEEAFDLKAFHQLVLDNGSVPLGTLEWIVEDALGELD